MARSTRRGWEPARDRWYVIPPVTGWERTTSECSYWLDPAFRSSVIQIATSLDPPVPSHCSAYPAIPEEATGTRVPVKDETIRRGRHHGGCDHGLLVHGTAHTGCAVRGNLALGLPRPLPAAAKSPEDTAEPAMRSPVAGTTGDLVCHNATWSSTCPSAICGWFASRAKARRFAGSRQLSLQGGFPQQRAWSRSSTGRGVC